MLCADGARECAGCAATHIHTHTHHTQHTHTHTHTHTHCTPALSAPSERARAQRPSTRACTGSAVLCATARRMLRRAADSLDVGARFAPASTPQAQHVSRVTCHVSRVADESDATLESGRTRMPGQRPQQPHPHPPNTGPHTPNATEMRRCMRLHFAILSGATAKSQAQRQPFLSCNLHLLWVNRRCP